MGKGKVILKTDLPREKGKLYFVKGNPLEIWEAEMAKGGRKKKGK